MKYYLDTNIIIYFIKGQSENIINHLKLIPSQSIIIPSIVIAEIEYGANKSANYNKTIVNYNKFINNFHIEDFNIKAALEYGRIRNELESSGNIIGPNDLMLASIVKANNGCLVTHNVKEFSRINDLYIEDWTE